MVEEFRQLDECKLTLSLGRCELEDLPAESLAERVGGKVLDLEIVLLLDVLQKNVDSLNGVDSMLLGDEAWSVERPWMDRLIAGLNVRLELSVDLDGPALVCLLLVDDELVILVE